MFKISSVVNKPNVSIQGNERQMEHNPTILIFLALWSSMQYQMSELQTLILLSKIKLLEQPTEAC